MTERESLSVPTNWVAKEDLLYCRPDLQDAINALDADDIAIIADQIGDALQETYWLAMGIVLERYLASEESAASE